MDKSTQSRRQRVIEGMAIWGSFYRENIDIFVEEYLQLTFLKWYQTSLLVMMNRARVFLWIAARGMGKSFLIAIFAVARCILYPGTKVVITSGTRGQAINVLEKIQTELLNISPNLKNEIDLKTSKFSGNDAKVMFKNTSYIKVVTASDNARSNRANILIVDEFRMVKKDTIDTVLKKFLTSRRMPPYRELSDDEKKIEYAKEPNKSCFLSSAFFKDHWSYNKMLDTFKMMLDDKKTDSSMSEADIRLAKVRNFRNLVQGYLFRCAVNEFMGHYEEIMSGSYEKSELLACEDDFITYLKKEVTGKNCFGCHEVLSLELVGDRVVNKLLDVFVRTLIESGGKDLEDVRIYPGKIFSLISSNFKYVAMYDYNNEKHKESLSELSLYDKLHLAVDFISGMTDSYAVNLYQDLNGIRLPQ